MKKFLLIVLLFLIPTIGHCATTWYACTSGGNWSANVWTSVPADQATCAAALGTPVAGDTATLNSSSGNITITSAAAAATLDETGYTGTLAFGTQTLTLTAGANLSSAMTSTSGTLSNSGGTITLLSTVTGSCPTLKIAGSQTLTASTFTWPGALTEIGTSTITLNNGGATWTNTGLVSITGSTTLNKTTTGDTLTANGGITMTSLTVAGSTANVILGGGTWSGSGNMSNNFTLAGNITISGTVAYNSSTLTYSSGTITTTGSTLIVEGACNLNTNGMAWNNITFGPGAGGNNTYTLNSNLTATNIVNFYGSVSAAGTTTMAGAFNIYAGTFAFTSHPTSSNTLKLVSGQTLFVSNSIFIGCTDFSQIVQSTVASSPTYIQYTGTKANNNISNITFTDVQASGNTLYNYSGGALTRTSNIVNVNANNINPRTVVYFNGAV